MIIAQSLDLISEDIQVAQMWVQVLTHIIQATQSVEMQREHESYLRSQFQVQGPHGKHVLNKKIQFAMGDLVNL